MYAVVDVETTGLNPTQDRIIEIAVVQLDADLIETARWSALVNPEGSIGAQHIHGISAADVADAPRFRDLLGRLRTLFAGRLIVAHHVAFDLAFLNAEFARAETNLQIGSSSGVCTMDQSRIYCADGSHALVAVAGRLGIPVGHRHRALPDAVLTAEIFRAFVDAEARGVRAHPYAVNRHGEKVVPAQWERAQPSW